MPGTTSRYQLPYLQPEDPPDIAGATKGLAEACDAALEQVASPPGVLVVKFTTPIAHNTWTTLSWDAAVRNRAGMWTSGPNIVVPFHGWWEVTFYARFASQATASGLRAARVSVNGIEQMSWFLPLTPAMNATNAIVGGTHSMELQPGAVITCEVYQTSGGSLNLIANTRATVRLCEY